jgi:carboxymethylenebutenolidase
MPDETPLSIHHPPQGNAMGGVIVIQEAFGVTDHIEDVCQRLADVGWLAVAPHIYHRTGDPVLPYGDFGAVMPHAVELKADGIMADIDTALAFLADAGFPSDATGIVGFCMGGTIAAMAGVERQLGAAVTFYGGGILEGRFGFPPLVEAIRGLQCPWLGLFGAEDPGIPVDQIDQLERAADDAEWPTEVVVYEGAGHAFNRDGSEQHHEPSAQDAWRRTLDWFADYLTTGATESPGL